MNTIARMRDRYQVTIPGQVRKRLNLSVGDTLFCYYAEGILSMRTAVMQDATDAAIRVAIRDRYQVTLPIKKFRARRAFSDSAVEIAIQDSLDGFSVRSLPTTGAFAFPAPNASHATTIEAPLSSRYPPRKGQRT